MIQTLSITNGQAMPLSKKQDNHGSCRPTGKTNGCPKLTNGNGASENDPVQGVATDTRTPSERSEDISHVLVTGGAGYLGSCLVPMLLQRGYKVTVYDTFDRGVTSLLPVAGDANLALVRGDVRDQELLSRAVQQVDTVVHLAAVVGYPACSRDPELATSVNVHGTQVLLRCLQPHQRLVYASTGSCYGAVPNGLCTEETPISPLSLYGRTKAEAEREVLDRGGVALRLATVFGVSPRMRLDLLVNDLTLRALREKTLNVYEADFHRTFIHVKDAAQAFIFAIDNYDAMKDRPFNVGDDAMNMTKGQVAARIRDKVPGSSVVLSDDGQDHDMRNYKVSHSKIRGLGFRATLTIDQGIGELIKVLPQMSFSELAASRNVTNGI
ncbi:unnamed protein product [Ixodes hexagonus]